MSNQEEVKLLRLEDEEEDCCVWCFPVTDEEFNQFQDQKCKTCLEEEDTCDECGIKGWKLDSGAIQFGCECEDEEEHSIHKTISDEEGILACQKVFEKMKAELADAADDYWISYNYCVAQGKKRDYLSMTEENLDDGNPNY